MGLPTFFMSFIFFVAMPVNKNALIRYKTIVRCLRNRFRRWTIEDLMDECANTLYDMEGITTGVSKRTIQSDIQIMRSDKLGFNAPIEVYDQKFYRYTDPDYSINDMPLTIDDCLLIRKAVRLIDKAKDKPESIELRNVLGKVGKRLNAILNYG